ncbi:channel protein TolC [Methylobacterium sp. Leaf469]|uniref:TolC family outer membrane protein n=1 Tax=unclassified Methylobacterium TaxID=2615210 RepID=UPI0007007187|nr:MULTISPECIES: TolC family outer membrane protein [unclassified Methylobacterium]USU31972.1 TolC family outer membrane protein [Methylobacterium sp. OTU13CASTA1]KQO72017.1 channel protein TolC [Methylobacterium sp. Leaf87]KQP29080.1 channel protein TolC [Methylobacterium sp. Leaf100]KQP65207.1 channel protein TolC [Methylobacterium sp. Leaf112]KQT87644.1 channel protein TolC [Methylobacterium sp. Leaf469]
MNVRERKPAMRHGLRCAGIVAVTLAVGHPAKAETLESALSRAYAANPTLNSNRAALRGVDENVAQAKSGYRPTVSGSADIGLARTEGRVQTLDINNVTRPGGASLTVNQTLFNGFQTDNQTRRAESNVLSTRETLRAVEMNTLFSAAQAYMFVLSDTANLELRRNNVEVLEEQLRQTRDRFNVGEVTRTDVAQAEARLAGARSEVSGAEATLRASIGTYRRFIGVEPRQLAPGRPLDRYVPANLDAAVTIGLKEHPQILASMHAVDVAEASVKVLEGQLYPTAGLSGTVQQRFDSQFPGDRSLNAQIVGRISVPLYEGGLTYSQIRQAKELVGQRRIEVEDVRDQIRSAIVTSWGRLEASKAQVIASQAQVQANEVALNGVREEARVGQRTTLDVLNAQQELLNSRVNLILAQRDRVVNSYGVVQTIGRLTVRFTALPVAAYSPKEHFDQVKDLWFGVRTPDGR